MYRAKLFSLLFFFIVLISCKKQLYDAGKTNAEKTSDNWWVELSLNGTNLLSHPVLLTTYNTSNDQDSIWVDDLQNIWPFKCKVKVDLSNSTFATNKSENQYYDITVKIENGQVLTKAGHSKSGVITDSIYMKVTFSDDPTDMYVIRGVARTGLIQDDY